jgi:hypothetical protein
MIMRYIGIYLITFLLVSCGAENTNEHVAADSMSKRDSLDKKVKENLPPVNELQQFNWFYSAFVNAAVTGNDSVLDHYIEPKNGVWIIYSNGAMPSFKNVKHIGDFKNASGKKIIPLNKENMIADPKEEELPVIDCEKAEHFNKSGCFTSTHNYFLEEKIWEYAGLTPDQDKQVLTTARTVSRTVVNTAVGRFYFSLIGETWYLSFIDLRQPCQA